MNRMLSIRSQLLMQILVPSLAKVYSILLQEEGHRGLSSKTILTKSRFYGYDES